MAKTALMTKIALMTQIAIMTKIALYHDCKQKNPLQVKIPMSTTFYMHMSTAKYQ